MLRRMSERIGVNDDDPQADQGFFSRGEAQG